MGVQFSADEIFEMAEQIERNGAKFYRKDAVKKKQGKEKVDDIIREEMSHVTGLSKQLSS